jgi:hypothetical protein
VLLQLVFCLTSAVVGPSLLLLFCLPGVVVGPDFIIIVFHLLSSLYNIFFNNRDSLLIQD